MLVDAAEPGIFEFSIIKSVKPGIHFAHQVLKTSENCRILADCEMQPADDGKRLFQAVAKDLGKQAGSFLSAVPANSPLSRLA